MEKLQKLSHFPCQEEGERGEDLPLSEYRQRPSPSASGEAACLHGTPRRLREIRPAATVMQMQFLGPTPEYGVVETRLPLDARTGYCDDDAEATLLIAASEKCSGPSDSSLTNSKDENGGYNWKARYLKNIEVRIKVVPNRAHITTELFPQSTARKTSSCPIKIVHNLAPFFRSLKTKGAEKMQADGTTLSACGGGSWWRTQ